MRHLLVALLLAACCAAHAAAHAAAQAPTHAAAQGEYTGAGHSYTPPDGFTAAGSASQRVLTAPEGDATPTLVDLASAANADDAVAQAWKLRRHAELRHHRPRHRQHRVRARRRRQAADAGVA